MDYLEYCRHTHTYKHGRHDPCFCRKANEAQPWQPAGAHALWEEPWQLRRPRVSDGNSVTTYRGPSWTWRRLHLKGTHASGILGPSVTGPLKQRVFECFRALTRRRLSAQRQNLGFPHKQHAKVNQRTRCLCVNTYTSMRRQKQNHLPSPLTRCSTVRTMRTMCTLSGHKRKKNPTISQVV